MRVTDTFEPSVNAAIVDDELHFIEEMKSLLASEPRVDIVATLHEPRQAIPRLLATKPDLLFLDIQMPELNGFDIVRELRKAAFEPSIIFVTAYDNFAIEAIKNAAFDYLLKPIGKEALQHSLSRYFFNHAKEERSAKYMSLLENVDYRKKIKLSNSGGFILLNLEDIIHIQADWNYSKIYISKDKYETVTMNLGMLENTLPEKGFMRINRSTIININYLTRVRRLARKCYLEKDGVEYEFCIPITRIRELERRL